MNCPYCGGANAEGLNRCEYCGRSLSDRPAPSAPVPDEAGRALLELLTLNRFVDAQRYLETRFRIAPGRAKAAINMLADLPRAQPYSDDEILTAIGDGRATPAGSTPAPASAVSSKSAPTSGKAITLGGCLGVLLVLGLCSGMLCLTSMGSWAASGAYRQALARAQASAGVREVFGSPVNPEFGFWTGRAGYGTSWTASFGVPISGPKRRGVMQVRADTRGSYFDENWNVRVTVNYDDGKGFQALTVP